MEGMEFPLANRVTRRLRRYALRVATRLAEQEEQARFTKDDDAKRIVERYVAEARPAALNLGCGARPMKGWLNIDDASNGELTRNLVEGLPYVPTRSVDYVFSEHFLEHVERRHALAILRDVHRVLKPGGKLRIAVPDLDLVVSAYQNGDWTGRDLELLRGFEAHYGGPSFLTRGEWFDMALRGWGHRYLYNEEDLMLLLKRVGFVGMERQTIRVSSDPFLSDLETRPPEQSALIVEAVRA